MNILKSAVVLLLFAIPPATIAAEITEYAIGDLAVSYDPAHWRFELVWFHTDLGEGKGAAE